MFAGLVIYLLMSATCSVDSTLSANAIGPIKIGMNETSLQAKNIRYEEIVLTREAIDRSATKVSLCRDKLEIIASSGPDGNFDVLRTSSSYFKTAEGAHVGSTLNELRKIYPSGKLYDVADDGYIFNFSLPGEKIYFSFDASNILFQCKSDYQRCPDYLGNESSIKVSVVK